MEPKNKQTRSKADKILKILKLLLLGMLLIIFALKYDAFNSYLISNAQSLTFLSFSVWIWVIKILSYTVQLLIDYLILLVLTENHRFPTLLIFVSLFFLIIGFLLAFISQKLGTQLPITVSSFFVKLVKSQVLLILFVAGYIVGKVYKA